ncbi:MAG: inner membrane CreD family protein [Hyphomicrobium sp.]|nr:inner membrane CreD family protein [Hyphomicrobium sp.]
MESLSAAVGRLLASPGFKFFLICGLILVLTIPLLPGLGLIGEREQRAEGVRQSVANEWGRSQYIDGPLLIVPLHGAAHHGRGRQARRGVGGEARGVSAAVAQDHRQGDHQGAAPLDL